MTVLGKTPGGTSQPVPPPPAIVAPTMPAPTEFPEKPPMTLGKAPGSKRNARWLFTRKFSALLSMVPTKFVVGFVPLLPLKAQNDWAGGTATAGPAANTADVIAAITPGTRTSRRRRWWGIESPPFPGAGGSRLGVRRLAPTFGPILLFDQV